MTDAETGEPLPGANVTVEGATLGTASDVNGLYSISGLPPGEHTLLFSFTGYRDATHMVSLGAGEAVELQVSLVPGIELDPIQITAGRQQEKMLEAPASITVIREREIELAAPQTAVKVLQNVVGLDFAQTGIDRQEVVLRGFNNVFSGSVFVLTDYRQSAAAVINANLHSVMPAVPIDLDRVEVVRGPGSALYGAGVGSGVIHYISKNAFDHPGVTIAAMGGQRSLMNFQARAAGVVADRLGVKVVGFYGRAKDFELDSCPTDLLDQKRFAECPDPLDAQQLFVDGPRDYQFTKAGMRAAVEYRMGSETSLHLDAGFGSLSSVVLSGIGTIQADGYLSSFAQVRLNRGHFFAQAYTNFNNSNDSFVYNPRGPVSERSSQSNIQAQYDLHIGGDRQELIFGIDLEFLAPNSKGTVYGRNEGNDNIQEYGAYVQSKTQISSKLDLVVALRSDYHNKVEKIHFSPRAGVVYKPSTTNSFRLTYNRSFANPSVASLFLDIIAARLPIGPGQFLNIRGRGAVDGFTWNRNPAYLALGAPSDLVASSLIPGMEGADMPLGLPTDMIYGLMYQGLAAIPDEDLAGLLVESLGLDPALLPLLTTQMQTVKALLHPDETQVQGFSPGQLGMLNLASQAIDPIANDLLPIAPIKAQVSDSYEIGYKGIVNDRVLLTVDAYYAKKKNFAGALQMMTPFVVAPTLTSDLTRDLAAGIAANADLATFLDAIAAVTGLQLTPEATAALLVGLAGDGLPSATTPIAVVQAAESRAGAGILPELTISYPNFGNISYFGTDVAVHVLASDNLSLFANLSWVSDDFFDHTETREQSEDKVLALNAPATKFKLGGALRLNNGLSLRLAGRHISGFRMISGQYIGQVDPYFLVDLGVGYRIGGGLRADLSIANLTNNMHREFIGAPKLGRVGTARLLYTTAW